MQTACCARDITSCDVGVPRWTSTRTLTSGKYRYHFEEACKFAYCFSRIRMKELTSEMDIHGVVSHTHSSSKMTGSVRSVEPRFRNRKHMERSWLLSLSMRYMCIPSYTSPATENNQSLDLWEYDVHRVLGWGLA